MEILFIMRFINVLTLPLFSQIFLLQFICAIPTIENPVSVQHAETHNYEEPANQIFLFQPEYHDGEILFEDVEKGDSQVLNEHEDISLIPDDVDESDQAIINRHRPLSPYIITPPPSSKPPSELSKRSPNPKRLPENYVLSKQRKLAETSPQLFGVEDVQGFDQHVTELKQLEYDPNFMAAVVGKEAARNHVPIKDVLTFIRQYDKYRDEEKKMKKLEKQLSGGTVAGWDEQDQKYFETYAKQQAIEDIKKQTNDDIGSDLPRKVLAEGKGRNKGMKKFREHGV